MNTCSNCLYWRYDQWTEEKYGMGVGVCTIDNAATFCTRHNCVFHEEKDADETD